MVSTQFLAKIPAFSSLSPSQLEEMAEHWTVLEKNYHDVIFKHGQAANSIYIIQEGSVIISINDANSQPVVLSHLRPGEMFGELTMFEISRRTANATAAEKTVLLEMKQNTFVSFLKKYPDISIKLLGVLARRIRDTNALLEQQVTRNVNDEMEAELTFADRAADGFANFIGSWTFIIVFTIIIVIWIFVNTYAVFFQPADPYPYILLNLILSCLAAIQAPVIMMSQGRQAKKDHLAAEMDYKVNLKSELQIEEVLEKLELVLNKLNEK